MIEQTSDIEFITTCLINPKTWAGSSDDGSGSPDLFFPKLRDGDIWVRSGDDGVFLLHAHNSTMFECHTMLLPSAYGRAVEIGKEALEWAFNHTQAERIITNVPRFNVLALRLAKKVGMTEFAINPLSFKKGGKFHDLVMFGINKKE